MEHDRGEPGAVQSYPRIVGETGGKDFIFAHPSADPQALAVAFVRGAFEYQGQKCSAASRGYSQVALAGGEGAHRRRGRKRSGWAHRSTSRNFMAAVIDEPSFDKTMGYIDYARRSNEAQIVVGGSGDKGAGYFVEPTVVLTSNPAFKLMREEIFAPVLTLFVATITPIGRDSLFVTRPARTP
ncbi:MAG: aldehyde dehydrogenase family protein [Thermoanaerobaculia bacterium]